MEKKKKIIFIVLDGLGDDEIPDFGGKTPLDYADTPNFDKKAKEGLVGLLDPVFYGSSPTSEEGHFALFGYDPKVYGIKRGIVTIESIGMNAEEGDIALRGNFATVEDNKVIDRRAGRIKDTKELIDLIDNIEIDGVHFLIKSAGDHRVGVLLKGKNLSAEISNGDPAYDSNADLQEVRALNGEDSALFTANIINKYLQEVRSRLSSSPLNKERNLPANFILLRGASKATKLPSFQERYNTTAVAITGKALYRDMAKMVGMEPFLVDGADGTENTNIRGKLEAAMNCDYGFVFVHFKATDTLGEDGKYREKADFIARIDNELSILDDFDGITVVTSDHSTCSLSKGHCDKKIPFLIHGKGVDSVEKFTEKDCVNGSLGVIKQTDFIKTIKLF